MGVCGSIYWKYAGEQCCHSRRCPQEPNDNSVTMYLSAKLVLFALLMSPMLALGQTETRQQSHTEFGSEPKTIKVNKEDLLVGSNKQSSNAPRALFSDSPTFIKSKTDESQEDVTSTATSDVPDNKLTPLRYQFSELPESVILRYPTKNR